MIFHVNRVGDCPVVFSFRHPSSGPHITIMCQFGMRLTVTEWIKSLVIGVPILRCNALTFLALENSCADSLLLLSSTVGMSIVSSTS